MGQDPNNEFPKAGHNHRTCVDDALRKAEDLCALRGARLTKLRRRVFELVWSSHAPVGAYELLRRLGQERGGVAPPTVYRALDFLREHGLIHRIERLNAFVGCGRPDRDHAGQFLICSGCGAAAEVDDPRVDAAIERRAGEMGFAVRHKTIEIEGLCPPCRHHDQERGHAQ
jgi:Fur family zinc uptake transcriptional regulator